MDKPAAKGFRVLGGLGFMARGAVRLQKRVKGFRASD